MQHNVTNTLLAFACWEPLSARKKNLRWTLILFLLPAGTLEWTFLGSQCGKEVYPQRRRVGQSPTIQAWFPACIQTLAVLTLPEFFSQVYRDILKLQEHSVNMRFLPILTGFKTLKYPMPAVLKGKIKFGEGAVCSTPSSLVMTQGHCKCHCRNGACL